MVDFIYEALNGRNEAFALMFDLTRAFDTVEQCLAIKENLGNGNKGSRTLLD